MVVTDGPSFFKVKDGHTSLQVFVEEQLSGNYNREKKKTEQEALVMSSKVYWNSSLNSLKGKVCLL